MTIEARKLSAKAKKAIQVLSGGGRFVNRLERNSYTGREQFQRRLLSNRGQTSVVKGFSFATFHELEQAGLLEYCPEERTSVSEYHKLRSA